MPEIIALKKARGKGQLLVLLEGLPPLRLSQDLAQEKGLAPGETLSLEQVEELGRAALRERGLATALRLLSLRPRSEAEVVARLRRFLKAEVVEEVLAHLRQKGLVDDLGFARFWRENREGFSPRGKRLLQQELRQKGVSLEVVAQALEGLDEEENALRAARRQRPRPGEPPEDFRRRLGNFLLRRGFSYEVSRRVTKDLTLNLERG